MCNLSVLIGAVDPVYCIRSKQHWCLLSAETKEAWFDYLWYFLMTFFTFLQSTCLFFDFQRPISTVGHAAKMLS